jgi:[ribosomal protein S5]-alanine N-acetyltransferase
MTGPRPIRTSRLDLVPLTVEMLRTLDSNRGGFATALNAVVPDDWPQPEFAATLPSIRRWLERDPALACWTYVLVLRATPRCLIGEIGCKGPPDATGTVEIGYALQLAARGKGYASEAVITLSNWALGRGDVQRVTAETVIGNDASERVLQRAGFVLVGLEVGSRWWEKR